MELDVQVVDGGSIIMFEILSEVAKTFVEENVQLESWQWMGNSFAVDHRYADDLIAGMKEYGLTVL